MFPPPTGNAPWPATISRCGPFFCLLGPASSGSCRLHVYGFPGVARMGSAHTLSHSKSLSSAVLNSAKACGSHGDRMCHRTHRARTRTRDGADITISVPVSGTHRAPAHARGDLSKLNIAEAKRRTPSIHCAPFPPPPCQPIDGKIAVRVRPASRPRCNTRTARENLSKPVIGTL